MFIAKEASKQHSAVFLLDEVRALSRKACIKLSENSVILGLGWAT